MIVYCSDLPNDQDLIKTLGSIAVPIPIRFGDVVFWGVDDDGEPIRVCVERKKIPDMASCILSGRYLNQAQSAKDAGSDVLVLALEGRYRPAPADGLLEIPGYNREQNRAGWKPVVPAIAFSRFDQYLTELEYLAGVIVKHTETVWETASVVKALWVFHQKPPSGHQSLKAIYKPPLTTTLLIKPGVVRRIAAELPGVGWQRSKVVAEHFLTVKAMVDADVEEWMGLEGIGKKTAERVVRVLRGDT